MKQKNNSLRPQKFQAQVLLYRNQILTFLTLEMMETRVLFCRYFGSKF